MHKSLRSLSNIGFGVALAVLLGIVVLSYHNTQNVADVVERRHAALLRLDRLLEFLLICVDIETGERGYVITGDPKFLEPYLAGKKQLQSQLRRLRTELENDPHQLPTLVALEKATVKMSRFTHQVVSLKESKADEAAEDKVATGHGKQIMDEIRQLITALGAREREQLKLSDERYQRGLGWNMFIVITGSLVGFAVVGFAALTMNRILRDRTRLNAQFRESLVANTATLDRLLVTAQELTRSNQELEQFAYVASHDLQEPLRKVSSFAELLANQYRGKLDPTADEFIGYMMDGAKRMQTLIQNLLAYSRLGRKSKPYTSADGNTILKQALSNLQMMIEESGTLVTSNLLPTMLADESQLVQLFQNLIENAIKFHGTEKPRIQVEAKLDGSLWNFSVRDNGIGIEPRYAERIFVIFQRLHAREEYPGTGIGLALCKKIVERHGGRIWLETQTGPGTTFCFTVPRSLPLEQPNP